MHCILLSAALLAALSVAAGAQPAEWNDQSVIRSALPAPNLPEAAKPSDFLRAARGSLAAGRKGEAQEALEMAQTRLLDRSVAIGHTDDPSGNPLVARISQARQALSAGESTICLQAIEAAIASAEANSL